MTKTMRNLVVWVGVISISLVLWYFTARVNLHFIRPMTFLGYVVVAAGVMTALLWWEISAGEDDKTDIEN